MLQNALQPKHQIVQLWFQRTSNSMQPRLAAHTQISGELQRARFQWGNWRAVHALISRKFITWDHRWCNGIHGSDMCSLQHSTLLDRVQGIARTSCEMPTLWAFTNSVDKGLMMISELQDSAGADIGRVHLVFELISVHSVFRPAPFFTACTERRQGLNDSRWITQWNSGITP